MAKAIILVKLIENVITYLAAELAQRDIKLNSYLHIYFPYNHSTSGRIGFLLSPHPNAYVHSYLNVYAVPSFFIFLVSLYFHAYVHTYLNV